MPQEFWKELFAINAGQAAAAVIPMRLLRRRGQPFLLLPAEGRLAALSLDLYAAQTVQARVARTLVRFFWQTAMPVGTEKVSLTVSPDEPFTKFLSGLAGVAAPEIPGFGILAGNPASPGQRFLVLVFDACRRPVAVVKAGLSEPAKALIQKEAAFLASLSGNTTGIPKVRAEFRSPHLRALAMDFFAGDSPRARDERSIAPLLSGWVDKGRKIRFQQTAAWAQLQQAASANDRFCKVAEPLRNHIACAAIHHGDFAPWNVKVSPGGDWTVLDWERGELAGIPGWDWFHYVLQTGILVEGQSTARLVQRIERLLGSEAFKQYATRAGISGVERWLVLAYLLHCNEVIKPAEGLAPTRELLEALCSRWAKG